MKTLNLTLPVLAAVSLSLFGCDDDDNDDTTTVGDTQTGGASTTTSDDASSSQGNETSSGEVIEVTTEVGVFDFFPEDITISVGDTVRFVMTPDHNAIEVTEETYNERGVTPIDGGFEVDFGETAEVTFDEAGVFWYVCQPHVTLDQIGTITVQ